MNFDLTSHTIFLTVAGSRAYGTNTEDSDYDYRGIAIAPINFYIGIKEKFEQIVDTGEKGIWKQFKQMQPNADVQIMNLDKFARLALDCNPSIIEILFTDPSNFLIKHPIMDQLLDNKQMFLSKRAKARFAGYAISQLNRIKRHKYWLEKGEITKPERSQFGLPDKLLISRDQLGAAESLIKQEANQFVIDQDLLPEDVKINLETQLLKMMQRVWEACHTQPFPIGSTYANLTEALENIAIEDCQFSENFLLILAKEKQYRAAKQEFDAFQTWKQQRNPKRAELEAKYGFDCKHASQLVRLLRLAKEIILTGQVLVKRPDAEELKAIRNGAWTYQQIIEFASEQEQLLNQCLDQSPLPTHPDTNKADWIVSKMILQFSELLLPTGEKLPGS